MVGLAKACPNNILVATKCLVEDGGNDKKSIIEPFKD